MRIAICDDITEERNKLKDCLYRMEQQENIELSLEEYGRPEGLIEDVKAGVSYDVVFLDVFMPGYIGTDVARILRDQGYEGSIIFCTTSEDHALAGFRVKADGYLVKPYTYEDFRKEVWRLDEMLKEEGNCIEFTSERIDYNIPLKNIICIETEGKGCRVHTKQESYFTWKKIGDFAKEISDESFDQISRSYIINLNQIKKLEDDGAMLNDETFAPFPAREAAKIRQRINDYFFKMTRGR